MAEKTDKFGVQEIRHGKCGGVYLARSESEVIADDEDCSTCLDVRRAYKESQGMAIKASPFTPLADELGLVVKTGSTGPVA